MTSAPRVSAAPDISARTATLEREGRTTTAVVPFAYDLGGRVVSAEAATAVLSDLDEVLGPISVDLSAVRSWNLSYLASHAPVLRADLTPGTADISGELWDYTRVLRLYPWLGVVMVEYSFSPPDADLSISSFYDGLVAWKNTDYLPHLHDEGALSGHLGSHTQWSPSGSDQDLHRSVVRQLREGLDAREALEPRPRRYAFHDFRPCFVVDARTVGEAEVDALLLLSDRPQDTGQRHDADEASFRGVHLSTTGWSTVIGHAGDDAPVRAVLDMLCLVHAQWFLCQAWISTYDADSVLEAAADGPGQAEEFARTQLFLARDLVEVDNLDLMLKDPALIRVARTLGTAFGLLEHRSSAERRLKVLDDYSRQIAEVTQARDAQRLQILFSLSAAGTIAGLIPAIASMQSNFMLTLATVVVGVVLWLGFAVNFAVLLRRRNAASRAARVRLDRRRRSAWRTGPA